MNPRFFRTASRNWWIRDDSNFRGRGGSRPGRQGRSGVKPGEKLENGLIKRVEGLEKDNATMTKSMEEMEKNVKIMEITMNNITEMMKKNNKNSTVKTQYVGEETDTGGSCVDKYMGRMMVKDSGAPMSLVSLTWL